MFDPRTTKNAPQEAGFADVRLTIASTKPWILKDDWRKRKFAEKSYRAMAGSERQYLGTKRRDHWMEVRAV